MTTKITFKANTVRTMSSPSQDRVTTYFFYVNFRDLPKGLPLNVNPREPNMKTAVAKALINAVHSPETDFDINNRGIVIISKTFKYNTNVSTVTLDLDDNPQSYGILDGGHTYNAIIGGREELSNDIDKFVKLEVIVGADLSVSRIADARNTSVSVSDIALYELDDKFDFVKDALKNEPYVNNIAIKDNSKKRLPIIELLKLLYSYNIFRFKNANDTPTQAYSGKTTVFKDIKNDLDNDGTVYKRLSPLLPSLVRLYNTIELEFNDKYREYNPNGKFGAVRGVEHKKEKRPPFKTLFLENDTNYKVSAGYILPVFGAFRALIEDSGSSLSWQLNPLEMWDQVGADLLKNTFESSRNSPQDAGKNASIWSNNYSKVENAKLRKLLENK